jgi:hypothetical protein
VEQVLAIVVGVGLAMLGREPVVFGEQLREAKADRMGVVGQAVDVRGEGGEGGGLARRDALPV